MKTTRSSVSLLALVAAALPLASQTAAPSPKPAVRHTTGTAGASRTATAPACSSHPEVTSKVPALPAGAPCARPLFTVTTVPSVKLDYISPAEGPELKEVLGISASSFSIDYVDTKVGTGGPALPHKWYTVHYTGYLADGTKFDSSLDRGEPITFPVGQHQVIVGWDTGFAGMHVGGKRRLYIPFQLAYGPNGRPPTIPARAELIFDMELVSQSDNPPAPKTPPTPPPAQPGASQPNGAPGTAPGASGAARPGAATTAPAGSTPTTSPAGAAAPPPTSSTTPAGKPASATAPKPQ